MPRASIPLVFFTVVAFSLFASAQQQAAPPKPPQTPRQALVEIATKGAEGISKHLTVEVQALLAKSSNKAAIGFLGSFNSMKPDKGLQAFDSGPVLFTHNDSAQHTKYEVRVDNDDMAGDQDDLQLSLHAFRDGQEQESDFGLLSPRFTVSLKQQQGIWRLSKISLGADVPIGDPAFFEKIFLKTFDQATAGLGAVAGGTYVADSKSSSESPRAMPPEQLIMMLGFAESTFASQHPDKGFTCSLTELAEAGKVMGIDSQVSTGVSGGYRIRLSGCEGRPAGSFQITAEPVVAAAGVKAYCTDATHNVRFSEDGKGSSCLAFGKVSSQELLMDEYAVVSHPKTDK
ncbi:MAG TPA: hypothetical protein VF532_13880 [Candidatus Angelobacter sp.]